MGRVTALSIPFAPFVYMKSAISVKMNVDRTDLASSIGAVGPSSGAQQIINTCNTTTSNHVTASNSAVYSYLSSSLKWCPTSEQELEQSEADLLAG